LDREAVDYNHHPHRAWQRICSFLSQRRDRSVPQVQFSQR
jgi:hypothetical protein